MSETREHDTDARHLRHCTDATLRRLAADAGMPPVLRDGAEAEARHRLAATPAAAPAREHEAA